MPERQNRKPSRPAGDGTPPSAKGRRTRLRLLEAAKEVFARDGFLDARISDISEAAGMAHGSFYHYFDSKEAIFREVAEMQEAALLTHREANDIDMRELEPYEQIRMANRRYLQWYRQEAQIMGVIEQVSRYDPEVNKVRASRQHAFAERSQAAIERLQQQGLADPAIDAAFAANALGAMVARVAEMWLVQRYDTYRMDHAVDQLTRLWANAVGLGAPSADPPKA